MDQMRMDPKHQFAAQYVLSRAANERREREALLAATAMNMSHFAMAGGNMQALLGSSAAASGLNCSPTGHSDSSTRMSTPAELKMEQEGRAAAAGAFVGAGLHHQNQGGANGGGGGHAGLQNDYHSGSGRLGASAVAASTADPLSQQQQQQFQMQQTPTQASQVAQAGLAAPQPQPPAENSKMERENLKSPLENNNTNMATNNEMMNSGQQQQQHQQQHLEQQLQRQQALHSEEPASMNPNDAAYLAIRNNPETSIRPVEDNPVRSPEHDHIHAQSAQQQHHADQEAARAQTPANGVSGEEGENNPFKHGVNSFAPTSSASDHFAAAGGSAGGYSELLNRYRLEQTIKHLHGFQDARNIGIPFGGSGNQNQI